MCSSDLKKLERTEIVLLPYNMIDYVFHYNVIVPFLWGALLYVSNCIVYISVPTTFGALTVEQDLGPACLNNMSKHTRRVRGGNSTVVSVNGLKNLYNKYLIKYLTPGNMLINCRSKGDG